MAPLLINVFNFGFKHLVNPINKIILAYPNMQDIFIAQNTKGVIYHEVQAAHFHIMKFNDDNGYDW